MKLRNKKTGEVIESACIGVFKHKSSGDCERVDTEARSLEKVLEVWEDYTPAEPLIKDEKIRKAVRAWAECEDCNTVMAEETFGSRSLIIRAGNGMAFWTSNKDSFSKLKDGEIYTIAELCGEGGK